MLRRAIAGIRSDRAADQHGARAGAVSGIALSSPGVQSTIGL